MRYVLHEETSRVLSKQSIIGFGHPKLHLQYTLWHSLRSQYLVSCIASVLCKQPGESSCMHLQQWNLPEGRQVKVLSCCVALPVSQDIQQQSQLAVPCRSVNLPLQQQGLQKAAEVLRRMNACHLHRACLSQLQLQSACKKVMSHQEEVCTKLSICMPTAQSCICLQQGSLGG